MATLTNRLRELLATGGVVPSATAKRMAPGAVHVAFFDELARRYAAYWERYRPADEARRPVSREEYAFLAEPGQLTSRAVAAAFRRFAACLSADTDDPAELLRVAREHLGGK